MILLALFLAVSAIEACAAAPENWVQVTTFTGSASQDTAYFTCAHAEWRINWSYTPDPTYPQYSSFYLDAYDNSSKLVSYLIESGNTTTSGLTYVHNNAGKFYFSISAANLQGYTITVEQDLDSIPEFPTSLLLVAVALAGTLSIGAKLLQGKLKMRK